MQFELTEEIVNQLIFSMENQNDRCVFDSLEKKPVELDGINQTDTDRYYRLPVWDSMQGFKVMECFVSELHNLQLVKELRAVLFAGKGVFRAFKDVLKTHPEAEQLWFSFKQKAMKQEIVLWYNALRDCWGLERIGCEPEETDELVGGDFVFRVYNEADSAQVLQTILQNVRSELTDSYGAQTAEVLLRMQSMPYTSFECKIGANFAAETLAGECAGYISVVFFSAEAKNTAAITAFYVFPQWRGLGIGKELLMRMVENLREQHVCTLCVPGTYIPDFFERFMFRSGFQTVPSGFLADLSQTHKKRLVGESNGISTE